MIRKIKVDQLKKGMFVHDLNCSWLNHPFMGRGKSIDVTSDQILEKIHRSSIEEVYIDTDKGLDIFEAKIKEEVDRNILKDLIDVVEKKPEDVRQVSFNEEIYQAKQIKKETMETVQAVIKDVKLGKQIEKGRIDTSVEDIIYSIFRNQDALMALGSVKNVDDYVYHHCISTCVLLTCFAKFLGIDSGIIREIGTGAMLHDIGITKISPKILGKKTVLTDDEFELVKKHVGYSTRILENTSGISEVSIITVQHHHERLDGTGYPNGLEGGEIGQLGQAMAIVDVYDALTTKRCYKKKIPPTEALKIIYEMSGTKFGTEMVEKFIRCIGIYPINSLVRLESGLLGIVVSHNDLSLLKPVVRVVFNTKSNRPLPIPYDIDLSKPLGKGGADRIVGYESPERFDILTEMFL